MQRKNDYHYVYVMPDLVRELAGTRDRCFSHYYAEVSGFRQIRLHWDFAYATLKVQNLCLARPTK
jgi:hypothetical protein